MELDRDVAGVGDVHERNLLRLAAGHLLQSRSSITANTTYVAGYLAPNGHYSDTPSGFSSAVTSTPLTALANGTSANGVYAYSSSSVFPTNTYNSTNYWVDVLFEEL